MTTEDRIVRMANEIARNLVHDADPGAAMAQHIRDFWDPRMKAMLIAHGSDGLSPIAAAARAQIDAGA